LLAADFSHEIRRAVSPIQTTQDVEIVDRDMTPLGRGICKQDGREAQISLRRLFVAPSNPVAAIRKNSGATKDALDHAKFCGLNLPAVGPRVPVRRCKKFSTSFPAERTWNPHHGSSRDS